MRYSNEFYSRRLPISWILKRSRRSAGWRSRLRRAAGRRAPRREAFSSSYLADITASTCCRGSQCSGLGSTVLHHGARREAIWLSGLSGWACGPRIAMKPGLRAPHLWPPKRRLRPRLAALQSKAAVCLADVPGRGGSRCDHARSPDRRASRFRKNSCPAKARLLHRAASGARVSPCPFPSVRLWSPMCNCTGGFAGRAGRPRGRLWI